MQRRLTMQPSDASSPPSAAENPTGSAVLGEKERGEVNFGIASEPWIDNSTKRERAGDSRPQPFPNSQRPLVRPDKKMTRAITAMMLADAYTDVPSEI